MITNYKDSTLKKVLKSLTQQDYTDAITDKETKIIRLNTLCDMLKAMYPDNVLYEDIKTYKKNIILQALTTEYTYNSIVNSMTEALQCGLKLV
jgi:hypothetical protein